MKAFMIAVLFSAAAAYGWSAYLGSQQSDAVATFSTQGVRL